MNPGNLKHQIILLKQNVKQKKNGDFSVKWSEEGTAWANITPLKKIEISDKEGWGDSLSKLTYRLLMRYRKLDFQRIKWRGKLFQCITPLIRDPDKAWLEAIIREVP
jgi:head-tail adaptor